jgi:hypothetical protein
VEKKATEGLAKLTGNRYKIALDESCNHETADLTPQDRLWYEVIPCKNGGKIYLKSLDPMQFELYIQSIKKARIIEKQVPLTKAVWLDGEAALTFSPAVLDQIAELAGARKKRRLSQEAKTKLIALGSAHQFSVQFDGVESEISVQG